MEQLTISPVDSSIVAKRQLSTSADIDLIVQKSQAAHSSWKSTSLSKRIEILRSSLHHFSSLAPKICSELTMQMGRPARYCQNEIRGYLERANHMLDIAEESLKDIKLPHKEGFDRYITKESLGVVAVVAAWNYPYLIAVNTLIPALAAGNSVILKHSSQTPLCAERILESLEMAGLPKNTLQVVHANHDQTAHLISHTLVKYVNFTGSVAGGIATQTASTCNPAKFISCGLELGGCDCAYVRADAPLSYSVENIVDGAFYNSGQSCCGIQRIYVHSSIFNEFVDEFVKLANEYCLGDPRKEETTLGPLVKASAADSIRDAIREDVEKGARSLAKKWPIDQPKSPYLSPTVLVNVTHDMNVMKEELFGPIVGIMAVSSDDEAVALMNDSQFGLTASIWSSDFSAAESIGKQYFSS